MCKPCISSTRSVVYHPQLVAVYHQGAGRYTLTRDEIQGRLAALDDIHHASRGDDIPSLREPPKLAHSLRGTPTAAWIKKEVTFGRQKLLLFWQGQKDLNPRPMVLETSTLPTELYPYIRVILYQFFLCLSIVFLNFCYFFSNLVKRKQKGGSRGSQNHDCRQT